MQPVRRSEKLSFVSVCCRFKDELELEGFIDEEGRACCTSPLLLELGWIPFNVSTDGVHFDRSGEYLSGQQVIFHYFNLWRHLMLKLFSPNIYFPSCFSPSQQRRRWFWSHPGERDTVELRPTGPSRTPPADVEQLCNPSRGGRRGAVGLQRGQRVRDRDVRPAGRAELSLLSEQESTQLGGLQLHPWAQGGLFWVGAGEHSHHCCFAVRGRTVFILQPLTHRSERC